MLHHLAGATIQVANLVNYKCLKLAQVLYFKYQVFVTAK